MPIPLTDRIDYAARDAKIVEMKREGMTFAEIGEHFGLNKSTIHKRFFNQINKNAAQHVEQYRAEELTRLELAREIVMEILSTRHVAISNGGVVREITGQDKNGKPVYGEPYQDDGITLQAIDRLLAIDAAESRLMGTAARPEVQILGQLSYIITGMPAPAYEAPAITGIPDDVPAAILP